MRNFPLVILIFATFCSGRLWKRSSSLPNKPVITQLVNNADGIEVTWRVFSFQPILSHTITYTDNEGRKQQYIERDGGKRQAVLIFVRPCDTYTVQVTSSTVYGASVPSDSRSIVRTEIDLPLPPMDVITEPHEFGRRVHWKAPPPESSSFSRYILIGREDNGELVEQSAEYSVTQAILTEFHYFHNYNLTMVTENSCGRSNESNVVRIEELALAGAPKITGVIADYSSIGISFEPDTNGGRVDYYLFHYLSPLEEVTFRSANNTQTFVNFTYGIEECYNYTFSITAVNPLGISPPASQVAQVLSDEIPFQPENLTVFEDTGIYKLSWDVASVRPILNQKIEYMNKQNETFMEWIKGNATTAVLHNATRCNAYNINVLTENACGWSPASTMLLFEMSPSGPCEQPQGLSASGDVNEVLLSWTAGSIKELRQQYDILLIGRPEGTADYWAPPTATSFTLTGFVPEAQYLVSLRAENECGWSPSSLIQLTFAQDGTLTWSF